MSLPLEFDGTKPFHDTLNHPREVQSLWKLHWGFLFCANSWFSRMYQQREVKIFSRAVERLIQVGITPSQVVFHSNPAVPIPATFPLHAGFCVGKLHGVGLDKMSGSCCWAPCSVLEIPGSVLTLHQNPGDPRAFSSQLPEKGALCGLLCWLTSEKLSPGNC